MTRIFIISNRGSVPSGDRVTHAGGLEVALRALLKTNKCVWVGWSGRAVEDPTDVKVQRERIDGTDYIVTDLSRQDFDEYYNGYANSVLWPVLHYRPGPNGIFPPRSDRLPPGQRSKGALASQNTRFVVEKPSELKNGR